jgi:hypothetical protein
MKINISFWDKKENEIHTIRESSCNPFKIGDKFYINVEDMYPKEIEDLRKVYNDDFVKSIIKSNEDKRKKLNIIRFKIISDYLSLKTHFNEEDTLNIEYKVKICSHWLEGWFIRMKIRNFFRKFRKFKK